MPHPSLWIPIDGDSMWPSLRRGDAAELVERAPRVGDVLVVRTQAGIVAHRVVSIDGAQVQLRGDNCAAEDPLSSLEVRLGVVDRVRRAGRVIDRARWDVGPRRSGKWRLALKRLALRSLRA